MMPDNQLLAWAASIIQQAQINKQFGQIVISVEGGVITRVEVKQSMLPPKN